MSRKAFEEFLTSHEKNSQEAEVVDWDQQRDEWLAFIDQFYHSLEEWFQPYKDKGSLDYQYAPVQLTEDSIGAYQTKKMLVQFAQQNLQITPIGTMLIATKGRIDMEGARGRVQFILADRNSSRPSNISVTIGSPPVNNSNPVNQPDWTWKVVLKDASRITFADFNEDNFFDALLEVVNA